ncbi:hypothetical protein AYL99_08103 [Fonsecaea erecta]|uniref:Uncharacterized protein n=1 Tax=Fonsecaea erecta TaxID=1367422 RepID=A0A178ZE71_9EURO|nr:hypothetical protein AYL99_08103 [Fonsecaea erecta]OAP57365.1 hypothetical protein AYL99_08103 [Fonsecaea erecta]
MDAVALNRGRSTFEGLPSELRLAIYEEVFQGAELYITGVSAHLCERYDDLSPHRLVTNTDTSLLLTSQLVCHEALAVLSASTLLIVEQPLGRRDPFENMPDAFLTKIKAIKVHIDAFVHIDRRRLPALQDVHLIHTADSPMSLPDVVRFIHCQDQDCGGMMDFVDELMSDVLSWKWKLSQYAFLGEQEGFAVKTTALWDCYANVEAGIVEFDCSKGTVIKMRGFIGEHETSVDDGDQAAKDWEAWSGL